MTYSFIKTPAPDAKKTHDPEFTKQDIKKGFSVSLMYRETGGSSNLLAVRNRKWRKEVENAFG